MARIEPFEGGPQEWASYVERFEQFLVANDITKAKKVMATFLIAVGAQTYELLKVYEGHCRDCKAFGAKV